MKGPVPTPHLLESEGNSVWKGIFLESASYFGQTHLVHTKRLHSLGCGIGLEGCRWTRGAVWIRIDLLTETGELFISEPEYPLRETGLGEF